RRLFADVTGVEDEEVGLLGRRRLDKAFARQRIRHTLGVVDVHLAAEGFDVKLARSAHVGSHISVDRSRSRPGQPCQAFTFIDKFSPSAVRMQLRLLLAPFAGERNGRRKVGGTAESRRGSWWSI